MPVFLLLICAFSVSLVICVVLTKVARDLANNFGLATGPSSSRHIHLTPIPRVGGVAIFVTFVLVYGGSLLAGGDGLLRPSFASAVFKVLGPATALFAAGLLDDLRGLGARTKLAIEVAGGIGLYLSGIRFAYLQPHDSSSWASTAVCLGATVGWVVLVCNAINLIDGIDGLAAGAALFSMVTIFTVGLVEGSRSVPLGTAILAGSVLGFLVFNFNPASIFLGDAGSLFVGFMLSGFALAESGKRLTVGLSLAIPLVSLALPLTDTALSVLRRYFSGHSLFGADREHIHHKLLELGLTQRQAVAILYSFSAMFAVLGLFLLYRSELVMVPVIAIVLLTLFFGVRRLKYQEFAEVARVWKHTRQQKEAFTRNIAVRKADIELCKLRDARKLPVLLETALGADFDGFELTLDPEVVAAKGAVARWPGAIECVWNNGYAEKAILTLELSTPEDGLIGRISLHRPVGSGWLVDNDLLFGHFRESLGIAIAKCVLNAPASPLYVRRLHAGPLATGETDEGSVIFDQTSGREAVESSAAE